MMKVHYIIDIKKFSSPLHLTGHLTRESEGEYEDVTRKEVVYRDDFHPNQSY